MVNKSGAESCGTGKLEVKSQQARRARRNISIQSTAFRYLRSTGRAITPFPQFKSAWQVPMLAD
jgi:hypothetical protein